MFSVFIQVLTNFLFLQIPLLNYYPSHASPLPPEVWQFLEMVLKVIRTGGSVILFGGQGPGMGP